MGQNLLKTLQIEEEQLPKNAISLRIVVISIMRIDLKKTKQLIEEEQFSMMILSRKYFETFTSIIQLHTEMT